MESIAERNREGVALLFAVPTPPNENYDTSPTHGRGVSGEGAGVSEQVLGVGISGTNKVAQEQVQGLLFGEQLSWQAIIYDLINTEQLDPWDVDITVLTGKYLEKVRDLEGVDFFVSGKVLLAASLLVRIKSEIVLNNHLPGLDDILFGREDGKKYVQERIELDEDVPDLVPRTPLPRLRKVTLQELMSALGKAIKTENRRIKKVVVMKQQEIETALALPKNTINLRDQIKKVYGKLKSIFMNREERLAFSELVEGGTKEQLVSVFLPLLHLDNNHRILLEQDEHFNEIWVWLKKLYDRKYAEELAARKQEVDEFMAGLEGDGEGLGEEKEGGEKG